MSLFMEASGLRSANVAGLPSYPARKPRMELDFILYSKGIEIDAFVIPEVTFSDTGRWSAIFHVTG